MPLLFSNMPLFRYPTSIVSPKFPHVPLAVGGSFFGYEERSCSAVPVQLVSKISNLCDHKSPTSQTDRQTDDMRSQDCAVALCTKVHCAVIIAAKDRGKSRAHRNSPTFLNGTTTPTAPFAKLQSKIYKKLKKTQLTPRLARDSAATWRIRLE